MIGKSDTYAHVRLVLTRECCGPLEGTTVGGDPIGPFRLRIIRRLTKTVDGGGGFFFLDEERGLGLFMDTFYSIRCG